MKILNILKVSIFILPLLIKAQKENMNIILSYPEEQEVYFYEYQPRLKIKATYTSLEEVENKHPEQLVQSVVSAIDQEWVNYNALSGKNNKDIKSKSHFEAVKKMDKNKNYFELHHKLTFMLGDIPTSIIKFFIHMKNSAPQSGAIVMQKVAGRWYTTSHPSFSDLSLIVMRLRSYVLKGIILGDSLDKDIQALAKQIRSDDGTLELHKLEEEFDSWYFPNKNKDKIKLFTDRNAW